MALAKGSMTKEVLSWMLSRGPNRDVSRLAAGVGEITPGRSGGGGSGGGLGVVGVGRGGLAATVRGIVLVLTSGSDSVVLSPGGGGSGGGLARVGSGNLSADLINEEVVSMF